MRLGDTEIAKVDGTFLYQSDIERLARERNLIESNEPFSQIDPNFEPLLEELIDQRLLSLGAVKRSLDQTSENKRRLANARERILGNILVEEHLKDSVNETTIRRMYDEQAALADRGDEVRARHILVSDEAAAKEVLKKLSDGEAFSDLAASLSLDEGSKGTGGDLGYFTQDMLDPDFTAVIFETEEGSRTDIFQSSFGWHIAEVIDRRPAQVQSFETLRPNIVQFMTYEAIQSLITDLRRDSEVEILYEKLEPQPESDMQTGSDIEDTVTPESVPEIETP
jgi:peptidyl-prolyl cis-trans isomerase C